MNEVGRRFLYPALAMLLAGLISLGLAGAVQVDQIEGGNSQISLKQSEGEEIYQNPDHLMGLPVDLLFSGHGFAIRGDESFPLRLKVEVLLPVQPGQIRDLVSSNKSLEEIRDDIRKSAGKEIYRGSLVFDQGLYAATNIQSHPGPNNSTHIQSDLEDINSLSEGNDSAKIGRINLTVSTSSEGTIGQGELEIYRPPNEGRYSVLLDMEPPKKDIRGLRSPSYEPEWNR